MAKSKAKAKAKAEKLPPVGTRWNARGFGEYTMTAKGPEFRFRSEFVPAPLSGDDRDWKYLDEHYGPRLPPIKPARDSMAMRRKAVAGVLGGWVYGKTITELAPSRNDNGSISAMCFVKISAENYAKFLADPTCNGAAT